MKRDKVGSCIQACYIVLYEVVFCFIKYSPYNDDHFVHHLAVHQPGEHVVSLSADRTITLQKAGSIGYTEGYFAYNDHHDHG
jgi:hypothetical protein